MNYRKCLDPTTAFPAPLIDALAGYIHLTQTLSFPAKSITLIGESAGAHLCLVLSRYLSDLSLPQPGQICLISPWADFTVNPSDLQGSYRDYADYDFLIPHRLKLGIRSATRYYTTEVVAGPYFSPALAGEGDWMYLKKEGTRVMVVYGTKELFEVEDKALVAGMKRDGVEVTVVEVSPALASVCANDRTWMGGIRACRLKKRLMRFSRSAYWNGSRFDGI